MHLVKLVTLLVLLVLIFTILLTLKKLKDGDQTKIDNLCKNGVTAVIPAGVVFNPSELKQTIKLGC